MLKPNPGTQHAWTPRKGFVLRYGNSSTDNNDQSSCEAVDLSVCANLPDTKSTACLVYQAQVLAFKGGGTPSRPRLINC